jgi:hypothetical protein
MKIIVCAICKKQTPDSMSDSHHEIPQAAGGHDGKKVSLCSGCHQSVHRLAMMLQSKRAGEAEDAAAIAFPDMEVRKRVFNLAGVVAEYMTLKRDGLVDAGHPARVMIELPIPVKLAAQMIANEHRNQKGRRLGLATWIAALVKREVYRQYPHLDPNG